MLYNSIIVDTANLYHRLKKDAKNNHIDIVKRLINYIEGDVRSHLKENGKIYLLFDPISYSDLGESKNFYYGMDSRRATLSDYKANRVYSPQYLSTIELFRKYYMYRGEQYVLLYSDEHEADDYVEELIKIELAKEADAAIGLLSTDHDWCSYISVDPKVDMINGSFEKPFTVGEFIKLYQFTPTAATNTFYKALIGDESDNITGAIFMKKAKFNMNVKMLVRDYLQELAASNLSLDDAIKQWSKANFKAISSNKERTAFEILFLQMSIVDLKVSIMHKLHDNIRVIRSSLSGKSLEPYMHSNPVNETINNVVHQSIYGVPFARSFGRV